MALAEVDIPSSSAITVLQLVELPATYIYYWDTIWDVVEQASTHWPEHLFMANPLCR